LDDVWRWVDPRRWFANGSETLIPDDLGQRDADDQSKQARETARSKVPVVWMLGKTGSGKSSIVRALTLATDVEIGTGYKPCTRTARRFDFPPEAPIIAFLDTRGLAEPDYIPDDDIAYAASLTNVLLVVMQADDAVQNDILNVLRKIRSSNAKWPIVVAQTGLHKFYASGEGLPKSDPFGTPNEIDLPKSMQDALAYQRRLFEGLAGPAPLFVPIDFTSPEADIDPRDFGRDRLIDALGKSIPAVRELPDSSEADEIGAAAHALILGYAAAGAAAGAIPVPFADLPALGAVVTAMLYALGKRYQVPWDWALRAKLVSALGGGLLLQQALGLGLREVLKVVPVVGMASGAAMGFTLTYAIGQAACVLLRAKRNGQPVEDEDIRQAFKDALRAALNKTRP